MTTRASPPRDLPMIGSGLLLVVVLGTPDALKRRLGRW